MKILEQNISDKGFANKYIDVNSSCNSIIQIQVTQLNEKWAKYFSRHITKEDTWMANKPMKRCSTSLVIREIQFKVMIRYHYTLIKMLRLKRLFMLSVGKHVNS